VPRECANGLLESLHFGDPVLLLHYKCFHHLPRLSFLLELCLQRLLSLSKLFDFLAQGLNNLCVLRSVNTKIWTNDSFKESVRVLDLVLDQRPHLLKHDIEILRFFLSFLEFLVENLLALLQQSHQVLIFQFQTFYFFRVLLLLSLCLTLVLNLT